MIRIPGDPEREWKLLQRIGDQIRERRRDFDHYTGQLDAELHGELPRLSASDRLKFRVLHRQFDGGKMPGLPVAVAAGRFLLRSYRKLRGA